MESFKLHSCHHIRRHDPQEEETPRDGGGKQQGVYMGNSSIFGHGYLIWNPPLAQPQCDTVAFACSLSYKVDNSNPP